MNAVRLLVPLKRGLLQTTRRPPPFPTSMDQSRLQSSEPVVGGRIPKWVKLSGGKRYAWCACGHSDKQPFCDGAHRTKCPSITPLRFTPNKDSTVLLCACKQTKNPPYCDGSHFKVIFRDLVKSVKGVFK